MLYGDIHKVQMGNNKFAILLRVELVIFSRDEVKHDAISNWSNTITINFFDCRNWEFQAGEVHRGSNVHTLCL